ncbi:MAG: ROK family protein [Clostridia bacterium]
MLDKNYIPIYLWHKRFTEGLRQTDAKPFYIALERGEGEIKVHTSEIYADGRTENLSYIERVVKTMLWAYGGYKFYFWGDAELVEELGKIYSKTGARAFDAEFMAKVYGRKLEFASVALEDFPVECDKGEKCGANKAGRRIGFDAGGSDRKVTACIDGKSIFEKEVVWHPKLHSDIEYHIEGIRDSIDMAMEKLGGKADAIGVSSAGIVVDGEMRIASLFRKVPEELYKEKVFPIYKNLAKEYGCPVKIANDGDIAALSGAFQLGQGRILGTSMGTSFAGGYIGENIDIKGYLNELAFVPVDVGSSAAMDEWSGDAGVGVMYHSQDAVIKLAEEAGIDWNGASSPANKLKEVQKLIKKNDATARAIFEKMGEYFAYTILWLEIFYDIDKVMLFGRVASEAGGDIIIAKAAALLKAEGSEVGIILPDENSRRLGQSYTAALL